jgi:hypothetical protein
MQPIVARCGYRCDLCMAYRPNVEANPANPQTLSDGWFKYFGFRLLPEQIICDGCMAESLERIDQECPVRPCATVRGLDNCAHCEEYVCDRLRERLVVYEEVRQRAGGEIPAEDRQRFIEPYENKARLDKLKAGRQ